MINNIINMLLLLLAFIPFILFVLFDTKANLKKEIRNKQFFMPIFALVYCVVLFVFMTKLGNLCVWLFKALVNWLYGFSAWLTTMPILVWAANIVAVIANAINRFLTEINYVYVLLILFNTCAMLLYIIIKRLVLAFFVSRKHNSSLTNKIVSIFYDHDEKTDLWYIKRHFGQAKTFLKTAFYATAAISAVLLFVSYYLCRIGMIQFPYYPVFAIILIGEIAFFIDGLEFEELGNVFSAEIDNSKHVTNYVVLRKRLRELFEDKLSSEGTTVNDSVVKGVSIDQILEEIEEEYGRTGKNYAMFIRRKALGGLDPNADYVRSGVELTMGKSLLFNTPFYYKLNPYVFYAMHTALLKGGKALIVLGRHGTTDDVFEWCENGLFEATNLPSLWSIKELNKTAQACDIGIVTRSGVHDLELHSANREFLNDVSFVVLIEPSRLVTTAQIGLNLLVRNISVSNNAVYCSVDKNCDGLVDSLSHIIMTNITEVSATEFPEGTSSYMCWTADGDYLQHRITPGISRYLGMGTELSFAALKNHVERTIWYGGDAFPVLDEHWIAKQYYHDLLSTTPLPATQETFDKYFKVSFNLCNEQVRDNSFITVEDEFNNLFEIKREFSTMSKKQGFVNVISSDYMFRGYMTENEEIFLADPKAIPYISADYARTRRNIILKICLQMSIQGMYKDELVKEFVLLGVDTNDIKLKSTLWKEMCEVLCDHGSSEISVMTPLGQKVYTLDVISYSHEFSAETGRFEDIFSINDVSFKQYVIDDLQSASYIAEKGNESTFLGTELKGHVLQKYLPGQFITLSGKYYEMLSLTTDNQVIVRRASDHINGRYSYRQTRKYKIDSALNNDGMGMLKVVNGVRIYNQFADFTVDTPSYWRLNSYNDFENGIKVEINNVPQRRYVKKHILKLDFSDFKDAFTKEVRTSLTLLINEAFKTLFAENQPYIVAVTSGEYEKPLTYSLSGDAVEENCIYILEDSQLDIGLLVSVERNFERIMHIISDYLSWNKESLEETEQVEDTGIQETDDTAVESDDSDKPKEDTKEKPIKRFINKIKGFFKKIFGGGRKKKTAVSADPIETEDSVENKVTSEETEAAVQNADGDGVIVSDTQEKTEEKTQEPDESEGSENAEIDGAEGFENAELDETEGSENSELDEAEKSENAEIDEAEGSENAELDETEGSENSELDETEGPENVESDKTEAEFEEQEVNEGEEAVFTNDLNTEEKEEEFDVSGI